MHALRKVRGLRSRNRRGRSGESAGQITSEAFRLLRIATRARLAAGILAVGAAFVSSRSAVAQLGLDSGPRRPAGVSSAFLERQRALERENQRKLQENLPLAQKFRVDYGGWYNNYFFLFDDGFNSSRTLRQHELRLWASMSADQGVHRAYIRGRMTFIDWNSGDNFQPTEDNQQGPELERWWYVFDFAQALRVYENKNIPWEAKIKVGRDLVYVGTGYAIDVPLDHVAVQAELFNVETTFTAGQTPYWTENIDRSLAVSDHSERDFYIIESKYKGWDSHEPFAYIAWQDDHTTESPRDLLQNYQYDSQYIGFGSTGELVDNLRYSSEWVIERGTSYGDRRFLHTNDIKAWGFDHRLDYYFRHKTKPVVTAEWMFASGDSGRLASPTNAAGGDSVDYIDNGFVGFGFRDTGISFSPRLSNIHIWRLGASFKPFPDIDDVKDLELGSDWYLYYKHHRAGAVSDPLADVQSGYLGWEMDYFANWRIYNDLSWTVRFGTFFPGKSFSDETTRTFLLTGVTWSF